MTVCPANLCQNDSAIAGHLTLAVTLKERGLRGTQHFIGDKCLGLLEAVHTTYPDARYQRCSVHYTRNVLSVVPRGQMKLVAAMLRAIHAQEDRQAAIAKSKDVIAQLREMKLTKAAQKVEDSIVENAIRPFAVRRKNWLFAGSPKGARASACVYSLVETARANDLDPFLYLRTLLEDIPGSDYRTNPETMERLMPWSEHMQLVCAAGQKH